MNDMERIQRGLEEFLQKQMENEAQKEIDIISTNRRGQKSRYDQEYEENWDTGRSSGRDRVSQKKSTRRRNSSNKSSKKSIKKKKKRFSI